MYRHIIAAVDGSHNADKALLQAAGLAAQCHAALTLVHIANLRDLAEEEVSLLGSHELHERAHRHGHEILARARDMLVEHGLPGGKDHVGESWEGGKEMARVLLQYAAAHDADLIVLGTHGRSGIRHLLLGSFAENVLHHAHCPLLVVTQRQDEPPHALRAPTL
ncbi:universal stress protein [Paludibacterium yongneupense]|uniref:universal stress protein n=1 Tax=Paludibacterium yongneupense TaxID=400061 RepID=UPI0004218AAA|nr:universal stress protein [Paludibacterium yongneupense]